MIFYSETSASNATSNTNSWTTSATASIEVPFASFWNMVSDDVPRYKNWWNMLLPSEYFWVFPKDWETSIDLPAHEKSIHGKPRGKLKAPKPQHPRGFRHLTLRHEFSGPHFR